MQIKREYNYNDVYLIPKKTIVNSRRECDTSVQFGPKKFLMPIVPANMKSVVNEETCKFLAKRGWFYVMHRFNVNVVSFMEEMKKENLFTSISIGVNEDTYRDLKYLIDLKWCPDYMTLDIANAWCPKAEKMIKFVKNNFPGTFLIVGNLATSEACIEIESWGADAIKVGIAGGKVCTTKNKTGFHRPMVSTVLNCTPSAKVPIIADGGIVEHGDAAKALACGATMVMAGNLFAGFDESAGDIVEVEGKMYKEYFGSASEHNKGKYVHVEGKKILVPYKGSMSKLLEELEEDLKSSISYAGGKDLSALLTCQLISTN
jgi:GMP reductase